MESCNTVQYESMNGNGRHQQSVSPVVDIVEGPEAWTIVADMPGVEQKSLELSVDNRVLTVQGKANGCCADGAQRMLTEFGPAIYTRKFRLSDGVDLDTIEAMMKDGVLRIVLPKSDRLKPRRIPIKAL